MVLALQVLVLLGIVALLYLARDLPKAYVRQKGQNIATKEDIDEITRIVEAVRSEHQSSIEHLRSDLTVLVAQKTALAEQQRASALDLFDSTVRLIAHFRSNLGDFPGDPGQTLVGFQRRSAKLFDLIFVQYHRLLLYHASGPLTSAAAEIAEVAMELKAAFSREFGPVKIALVKEHHVYGGRRTPEYEAAVDHTNEVNAKYRAVIDPLRKRLWDSYQAYLNALGIAFRQGLSNQPE
jgi:hypothetical protein